MNAEKFVKENKLQNIELEIGGKRESIFSILERFQAPIKTEKKILEKKINSITRLIDTNPMSRMTEMEYKREITESNVIIKTLIEL